MKPAPSSPPRTCIAGGGAESTAQMVRFALDPAGVVTPDLSGRLPGRGAWVTANRASVASAVSKKLFARAFKAKATAPEGLIEAVASGLERRALDAIGLARRGGQAVAGFDQVKAAFEDGTAAVLVTASDAAEDGAQKLARIARGAPAFRLFTSEKLSAALGKEGVRHAALKRGPSAERFVREAQRLVGFAPEPAAAQE